MSGAYQGGEDGGEVVSEGRMHRRGYYSALNAQSVLQSGHEHAPARYSPETSPAAQQVARLDEQVAHLHDDLGVHAMLSNQNCLSNSLRGGLITRMLHRVLVVAGLRKNCIRNSARVL